MREGEREKKLKKLGREIEKVSEKERIKARPRE